MGKLINAFNDGVFTGGDWVGTLFCYGMKSLGINPNFPVFLGYIADTYSLTQLDEVEERGCKLIPQDRDLGEQVTKAFGDVVGLAASPVLEIFSLGLAAFEFLSRYSGSELSLYHPFKLKDSF